MLDDRPVSLDGIAAAQAGPARPSLRGKVGVLLTNLGTPDSTDYWTMRSYLDQFLSDRRVIEWPVWIWQPILKLIVLSRRPFTSGEAYREIWNNELDESPLLTITRSQTDLVRARLKARHGDRVMVDFSMRYGNPSTPSVIRRLQAQGCDRILFFPLYPQYAASTTATANDEAFRALMKLRAQPAIRTVPDYHDNPDYIDALALTVREAYAKLEERPTALVASYHGLPEEYIEKGDPYFAQCHRTSELLADKLGWDVAEIHSTFQSRFGPDEWIKPYTVKHVAELAREGHRRIAVIAPGFAADCVETLEEITGEIREAFEEAGGEHFHYIPCLNDIESHITMMDRIIERELQGWV